MLQAISTLKKQSLFQVQKVCLIYFEQKILNDYVGSQDQIAAAYGGFNKITFKIGGEFNVRRVSVKKKVLNKLNSNLNFDFVDALIRDKLKFGHKEEILIKLNE